MNINIIFFLMGIACGMLIELIGYLVLEGIKL